MKNLLKIALLSILLASCNKEEVLIYKLSYKTTESERYTTESHITDFNVVTFFESSTIIKEELKDNFLKSNFKRYDKMNRYIFEYYCTKSEFNNK